MVGKEKLKEWQHIPDDVICKNKASVCMKCLHYSRSKRDSNKDQYVGTGTCSYLLDTGYSRPCLPTECVEQGIFRSASLKDKDKVINLRKQGRIGLVEVKHGTD